MRIAFRSILSWLGLLLVCSPLAAQPAALDPPALSDRPSDSLLYRPDLQALVDLQVERDGTALIARLGDPDAAVRARAAFALASVQDSAAMPALLPLLRDPHPAVRADAAFALGQMRGAVPVDSLWEALTHTADATVRRRLVEALGKQGDAASLARLTTQPWDDTLHADVALAVGRYALRGLHAPEATAYLVERLHADDPAQRLHAAYYVGRSRETQPWQPHADTVRAVLDRLALDDPTAMHLVLGLGRLDDPIDTPRLLRWMKEAEDWRTRVNAVRALSRRTDEKGIRTALYEQLVDPSVHVAVAAAQALNDGKTWSAEDADIIKTWMTYNAYAWRITSPLLQGLAQQGALAFVLNELERRRNSRNPLAYARGLPALAYFPPADAFDILLNAAHHQDTRIAYAALNTLAARWKDDRLDPEQRPAYFDVFAYALRRKDLATVYAAAPVLSDSLLAPYGTVAVLQEVFQELKTPEDVEPMTAILAALGRAGDAAADSLLRQSLTHPHPVVRDAAASALRQLTGETVATPPGSEVPERTIDWAYLRALGPRPQVVFGTTKGAVTLVFDAEQAPLTTQTLAQFARDGSYQGVPFHRVVPNFVVQGGDFTRGDGFGGPPFNIRSEFTRLPYQRGTAGMASAGKDTEGSQFFITHSIQPHLDGRYTAFGYVVEGHDVVDQLYEDDRIVSVTILPDTR